MQLAANPRNWRIHPGPQQDALLGSLAEVGWVQNVIVNRATGFVVDGHARILLAERHGQPTVPVTYVDLTDAEEALILASLDPIGAMAGADRDQLDALLRDIDTGDTGLRAMLDGLRDEHGIDAAPVDGLTDPDDVPEPPANPTTKPGDVWRMGSHRLVCGDAGSTADRARALDGAAAGCLVFDPPWDAEAAIPPGTWPSVLAFCDGRRAGDVVALLGSPTWVFAWDCVASWYSPNRPLQRMKLCFWFGEVGAYDGDGSHYGEPGEAHEASNSRGTYSYVPDPRGKHLSDLFALSLPRFHAHEGGHRHAKPVDWMRCLVANTSSGPVLDPFAGSGTALVACEQLGRPCLAIEVEPAQCDVIVERWESLTGQSAGRSAG